jgi:hypothetical protein
LLSDEALRHRVAAQARERALGLFQIGQMLETFRGVYKRVTTPPLTYVASPLQLVGPR